MEPTAFANDQLEQTLIQLQSCNKQIKEVAKYMFANKGVYPMDLLTVAVLNRSCALLDGFIVLVRGNNSLAALHFVRLQLDSLLRYYAAWLVDEPNIFAAEVFSGKAVKKIKDRTGELMQDYYLVKKLSEEYPWVSSVYQQTSGYIHLSEKHYHSSTKQSESDSREFESTIAKDDKFIPNQLKVEATEAMFEITTRICGYCYGWADTKHGEYGEVNS